MTDENLEKSQKAISKLLDEIIKGGKDLKGNEHLARAIALLDGRNV